MRRMFRLPKTSISPISPTGFSAGVALWLLAVDNFSFWRTFISAQTASATGILAILLLGVVLWLAATTVLRAVVWSGIAKPMWMALLITSALAAHFVDGWGALLDKAMLRNVLQTDSREAWDLFTWPLVGDLLIRGVLPAFVVLALPLRASRAAQTLKEVSLLMLATAAALALALATLYPIYATTFRNHRELRLQLIPSNYLGSLYSLAKPRRAATFQSIAGDAVRNAPKGAKPLLVVLVVGETARAENFSLGGYERPTNDALRGKELVFFRNVTSCGTDTASSLPCMFSDLGRSRFSVDAATGRENVLDVLSRSGVSVQWLENNSGCKGVCDRISSARVEESNACPSSGCLDDALISALEKRWPAPGTDALIVLHQQGSHGPAYYKRYPAPGRFQPACETNRLQDCSAEQVVNAYDNSIHYTSQVLSRLINLLEARNTTDGRARDILLLYVSDHGESLGEKGIYLHGMPPMVAPHEQSHIPMLMWLDAGASERLAADRACMQRMSRRALSHDNLFHTLLGVFEIISASYEADLDIFSAPRGRTRCPALDGPPPVCGTVDQANESDSIEVSGVAVKETRSCPSPIA